MEKLTWGKLYLAGIAGSVSAVVIVKAASWGLEKLANAIKK